MKGIGEWVFSHLVSKLSASSMPLSSGDGLFHVGAGNEDRDDQASTVSLEAPAVPSDALSTSVTNQRIGPHPSSQQPSSEDSNQSNHIADANTLNPLQKVKHLRIKFLRLLRRLRQSEDNLLVAKVLYRLHLASLIRAEESDLKRINIENNKARAIAREQETAGHPELDFSIRILVLGKTGVGKSATINSIFDQPKTETNAFKPGTDCIQEVTGTVNGIKITFIDTPGFLPASTSNMRRNKKIMHSVKRFIGKSPPDIVLYFERLDHVNMGYSDFPLLKLITDVFGSAIWFNTILVLTHSSSNLPEGPNSYPVNYDSYVSQCINLLQQYVHQAVSDSKLENPVLLVENHPQCRRNLVGEKILLNGKSWMSEFLLLCLCTKVLGDANSFLKFCGSIELGPPRDNRQPSLPHLLSSFLLRRSTPCQTEGENDYEILLLLSDTDEEDEYEKLPPIRILTKSQFQKLNKSHRKAYLDELDYRETLYLRKQLKDECQRRNESRLSKHGDFDDDRESAEPVQLPDMAIPLSFDSDYPLHRYRCIVTGDQWLARPVLDPHGWDHDVGFDGINLESTGEVRKNTFALISGQISKDKQYLTIQSELAAAYNANSSGATYSIGMDVQSSGKDLIYTVHSNAKVQNLKCNVTDCGVALTSFGDKFYAGAKLEDSILVGKRLKFMVNGGGMAGPGEQVAYGGSFEASLRSRDYPVKNENNVSLTVSAISFKKEMVLGGGLQSEFKLSQGTKVAINTNLNSRNIGQVSVKLSSSEHMEIAFVAIFAIFRALACRKGTQSQNASTDALEMG